MDIKKIIEKDISAKANKYIARTLYYPTYGNTSVDYYINGNFETKETKGNSIKINYLKQLVTQKIDYILSNPATASMQIFDINEILNKMMLSAALDTCSWLHLFINRKGMIDWVIVPDSQIIPLMENRDIIEVLRYYKEKDDIIIEHWTNTDVSYYVLSENTLKPLQRKPHYVETLEYNEIVEDVKPRSFGVIPFIPLWNNRDHSSDAEDIQTLLFMYDSICSGFIDNINQFQEAIIKLKNFSGDTEALAEALKMMKQYKAVGLPPDGDVDYLKVEIPVEARQIILNILKDAIYSLGRGVDVDKLVAAGNLTNVYIKSRYQALDFKANETIHQANIFYKKLIEFFANYGTLNLDTDLVFNKSLIINEDELITACISAIALVDAGIMSKTTLQEKVPWIYDIEEEKRRLGT